jgi:hypothetical protein
MIQYASTWTHHCILIVKFCLCPVFGVYCTFSAVFDTVRQTTNGLFFNRPFLFNNNFFHNQIWFHTFATVKTREKFDWLQPLEPTCFWLHKNAKAEPLFFSVFVFSGIINLKYILYGLFIYVKNQLAKGTRIRLPTRFRMHWSTISLPSTPLQK